MLNRFAIFVSKILWRWRVRAIGAERLPLDGPYIIAANHNSYFDAPSLSTIVVALRGVVPAYPTKPSVALAWRRLLGPNGPAALGMIPIAPDSRAHVLDTTIAFLNTGGVVGIFPEGTRNKPWINPKWPAMLKGKTGLARMVLATRVPVVPAAIIAPAGISFGQTIVNFFTFWKKITVTFSDPIEADRLLGSFVDRTPETIKKEELEIITRRVMLRVASLTGQEYPY